MILRVLLGSKGETVSDANGGKKKGARVQFSVCTTHWQLVEFLHAEAIEDPKIAFGNQKDSTKIRREIMYIRSFDGEKNQINKGSFLCIGNPLSLSLHTHINLVQEVTRRKQLRRQKDRNFRGIDGLIELDSPGRSHGSTLLRSTSTMGGRRPENPTLPPSLGAR
jgi:hypothetical protein